MKPPITTREDIAKAVSEAMSARDVQEIKAGLEGLGKKFDNFLETLAQNYVTKTEFNPVKNIAYGTVAAVCLSFLGALFYLVTHFPQK